MKVTGINLVKEGLDLFTKLLKSPLVEYLQLNLSRIKRREEKKLIF